MCIGIFLFGSSKNIRFKSPKMQIRRYITFTRPTRSDKLIFTCIAPQIPLSFRYSINADVFIYTLPIELGNKLLLLL